MRVASLLIVVLLTGLLALPAQADWELWKIHDHQMIHGLRKAESELSKVKHNYKGHKSKGVKHIRDAIKHLKADTDLNGSKGLPPVFGKSDGKPRAHLHHAIKGLKHYHHRLEHDLNRTPHRDKARHHIHHAIKDLEAALKVKQPSMKMMGKKPRK
jgi:hypothetical protein